MGQSASCCSKITPSSSSISSSRTSSCSSLPCSVSEEESCNCNEDSLLYPCAATATTTTSTTAATMRCSYRTAMRMFWLGERLGRDDDNENDNLDQQHSYNGLGRGPSVLVRLPSGHEELLLWIDDAKIMTKEILQARGPSGGFGGPRRVRRRPRPGMTRRNFWLQDVEDENHVRDDHGYSGVLKSGRRNDPFSFDDDESWNDEHWRPTRMGSLRFAPSFVLAPRKHNALDDGQDEDAGRMGRRRRQPKMDPMSWMERVEFFTNSVVVAMESLAGDSNNNKQILLITAIEFCRYYAMVRNLHSLVTTSTSWKWSSSSSSSMRQPLRSQVLHQQLYQEQQKGVDSSLDDALDSLVTEVERRRHPIHQQQHDRDIGDDMQLPPPPRGHCREGKDDSLTPFNQPMDGTDSVQQQRTPQLRPCLATAAEAWMSSSSLVSWEPPEQMRQDLEDQIRDMEQQLGGFWDMKTLGSSNSNSSGGGDPSNGSYDPHQRGRSYSGGVVGGIGVCVGRRFDSSSFLLPAPREQRRL